MPDDVTMTSFLTSLLMSDDNGCPLHVSAVPQISSAGLRPILLERAYQIPDSRLQKPIQKHTDRRRKAEATRQNGIGNISGTWFQGEEK